MAYAANPVSWKSAVDTSANWSKSQNGGTTTEDARQVARIINL